MRLRAALALALALAAAGCGGGDGGETTTAATTKPANPAAVASAGLHVGVVGALTVSVPGVVPDPGRLEQVAGSPLVLVARGAASLGAVAEAARSHPASHFALVSQSTKGDHAQNLVGLVLSDSQAARLGGIVAGFGAADAGGAAPRVAWVGPADKALAAAFARGVHGALASAVVLNEPSPDIPAQCKEAALAAIDRGAMAVMADRGICARAAVAGAREQNVPGLQIADFEFPNVAVGLIVRDALAGSYHGGEDLLFGASSGAIGIGTVDPRISVAALVRARAAAQALAQGGP